MISIIPVIFSIDILLDSGKLHMYWPQQLSIIYIYVQYHSPVQYIMYFNTILSEIHNYVNWSPSGWRRETDCVILNRWCLIAEKSDRVYSILMIRQIMQEVTVNPSAHCTLAPKLMDQLKTDVGIAVFLSQMATGFLCQQVCSHISMLEAHE